MNQRMPSYSVSFHRQPPSLKQQSMPLKNVDVSIQHIYNHSFNHLERQYVEALQPRGHAQHLLPVISIVEVSFLNRVSHPGRVTPDNVEVSTRSDPSLGMPLHLSRAGIVHRRREYRHHRSLRIQHSIFKNLTQHNRLTFQLKIFHLKINFLILMTFSCCFMRQVSGTSSSLV